MIKPSKFLMIVAALAAFGTARAEVDNFDFDSLDPAVNGFNFTTTPFTMTSSGTVTANFSSPQDAAGATDFCPSAFCVLIPGSLSNSHDYLVATSGPGSSVEIDFSQSLSAFSGPFATGGSDPLTLMAYSGGINGSLVGSVSVNGQLSSDPNLPFPEGTVSFAGTFDTLVLSAGAEDGFFGLGSFSVTTAQTSTSVPEPSSLALMALGLGAAALIRRRPRRS